MLKRTQKQQPSSGAAQAVVSTQPKFTKEKLRKFHFRFKGKGRFLKSICNICTPYLYRIHIYLSYSLHGVPELYDT